jgi:cation-transporting ATPase E
VPAGIVASGATFSAYAIARVVDDVSTDEARTAATLALLVVGLWVLNVLARPITPLRALLFGSMVGAFLVVLAVPWLREYFALDLPPRNTLVAVAGVAGAAILLLELGWQITQWRQPREERTRRLALRNPAIRANRDV